MPRAVEEYLKPEVVRQIARLDLRAQFIVKGFLQGLHASPYQGFSVEFSEHRRYASGDDPNDYVASILRTRSLASRRVVDNASDLPPRRFLVLCCAVS